MIGEVGFMAVKHREYIGLFALTTNGKISPYVDVDQRHVSAEPVDLESGKVSISRIHIGTGTTRGRGGAIKREVTGIGISQMNKARRSPFVPNVFGNDAATINHIVRQRVTA